MRLAGLFSATLMSVPIAFVPADASARKACDYVTRGDVGRVLGWTVHSVSEKKYDLGGLSGKMCFLESALGVVTVTLPDPGAGFPGITPANTTEPEMVRTLHRRGAYVELYNGTVYVSRHGIDLSVHVIPNDHPASYADVQPFADVVIARMK